MDALAFLKPRWWLCLLIGWALAACSPSAPPAATQPLASPLPTATITPTPFLPRTSTPAPTLAASPTASPSPAPTATPVPAAAAARPLYQIHIQLDYATRLATVAMEIAYPNQTGVPLRELVLNVEPARWEQAFSIQYLAVDGAAWPDFQIDGTYMKIPLQQPLLPGQVLNLDLDYHLSVPLRARDDFFGYDGYQLNLVDWYPRVLPYDVLQGWLWHRPWVVGEHQAYDLADFDIYLQVENAPEGLMVAASALPVADEAGHYVLSGARTFVFSLSPEFLLSVAAADGFQVYAYYPPDLRFGGKATADFALQALQVYRQAFGEPPHKTLTLVALSTNDGMEYSGLMFLPRKFYETYEGSLHSNLAMLTVHEVAHQWWFEAVGNDQALHPWLDEALATYSERVFYAAQGEADLFWWWNFRVLWFKPQGIVNGSIYQYDYFRDYVDAVYLRGALFLDALRQRVGEATFAEFLRAYYARQQGTLAAPDDFFSLLQAHTQADYSDLLQTYFAP